LDSERAAGLPPAAGSALQDGPAAPLVMGRGSSQMTASVERVQEWWEMAVRFLREVRVEMKKVTWPQRKEIIGSTAVVIVASFLVSFFLGFVDLTLQKLLGFIVK
jgi:preprotein translocase subunit SecE